MEKQPVTTANAGGEPYYRADIQRQKDKYYRRTTADPQSAQKGNEGGQAGQSKNGQSLEKTQPLMERTFDRRVHFDERSRSYPATLGFEKAPLRSFSWNFPTPTWLDQGSEGACVGFAWSHELAARPHVVIASESDARDIYRAAQKIDEYPGEAYDGTSVLAGAKIIAERYGMAEYRWAFGIEDLIRVLGYRGPCVLGINWYSGMENTDDAGFIRKSGSYLGGHAILARAVKVVFRDHDKAKTFANLNLEASYVTLRNSWGRAWGLEGRLPDTRHRTRRFARARR